VDTLSVVITFIIKTINEGHSDLRPMFQIY